MPQTPLPPRATNYFGPSVGAYLPSSGKVGDAFGSPFINFGGGIVSSRRPGQLRWRPDFDIIGARQNGNALFALPIGLGIEKQFGRPDGAVVPFARFKAGVAYLDYALTVNGDRISGKTFRPSGSLTFGALFGGRVEASVSYFAIGAVEGLDFSGFRFRLAYGLFRLPGRR